MLKIGVTGGIGSGKSIVSKVFETMGVKVYYADEETKALTNSSPVILEKIRNYFGEAVFDGESLNRKALGKEVFGDGSKLAALNEIIHPEVAKHYKEWCQKYKQEKYTLKEAAIIFEAGTAEHLDYVILVESPVELRISRVMERDGISREEVLSRMDKQWTDEKKRPLADFVIINDEEHMIIPQVLEIHEKLMQL